MKNAFLLAIKSIWINKTRSFLTTLGVIIGVGSVVMLTSIGTGLSAFVEEQFDALGANTVLIYPGDVFGEDKSFSQEARLSAFSNSRIKLKHVKEVRKLREYVDIVVPLTTKQENVSYRDASQVTGVLGVTYEYPLAQNAIQPEKGRFFTADEENSNKKVAVIGYSIADEMFGTIDPIGKKLKIGSSNYKIVGVMEESGAGSFGGPSIDTYVYIPINMAFKQFDTSTIFEVIVKTKSTDNIPDAIRAIETTLLKSFDEDEFSVFEQSDILETIQSVLGALTIGLGGISSISLFVGGIGIMNIMLVTVTERTREIGLRKALGATPNMIMVQFLFESALLSILGGTIGMLLAFLGTWAMQSFIPAKITPESVAIAFGVSMAVGLIFGAAPARRAANLSPIEALRYE